VFQLLSVQTSWPPAGLLWISEPEDVGSSALRGGFRFRCQNGPRRNLGFGVPSRAFMDEYSFVDHPSVFCLCIPGLGMAGVARGCWLVAVVQLPCSAAASGVYYGVCCGLGPEIQVTLPGWAVPYSFRLF